MKNFQNKGTNNKTVDIKNILIAVTSLLVLSLVSAAYLTYHNVAVYAQSSGVTVSGTCDIDRASDGTIVAITPSMGPDNPEPGVNYYFQILENDVVIFESTGTGYPPISALFSPAGTEWTYNLYEDIDNDFESVGAEQEELLATTTILCPPSSSQPPDETPVEQTQDLQSTINNMNIPENLKTSLLGPLTNIEKILTDQDPSNDADACTKLSDFITSVNDKAGKRGGLTTAQAEELISQAEAIQEALGC